MKTNVCTIMSDGLTKALTNGEATIGRRTYEVKKGDVLLTNNVIIRKVAAHNIGATCVEVCTMYGIDTFSALDLINNLHGKLYNFEYPVMQVLDSYAKEFEREYYIEMMAKDSLEDPTTAMKLFSAVVQMMLSSGDPFIWGGQNDHMSDEESLLKALKKAIS